MHTVQVTRWGGPDVLQVIDVPEPQPGPGQVLIDVEAIEVLFVDTQIRAGWGEDYFPMRPPFVPGTGVMGTSGGRRVVARTGDEGGYAEQVVVPAAEAVDVPDRLDDPAVALAGLHDGVLALQRLELSDLEPGRRVLVTGAAGALGHFLVPLAKRAGAHVTGAAGGPRKTAAVTALGADETLDYRQPDWPDRLHRLERFDVVFDGVGGEIGRAALQHTLDGGIFHAYGAAAGDFGATESERDITIVGIDQQIDDADWLRYVREALQLLADRTVVPVIGQRVPLEDAAAAHEAIQNRTVIGKTVLLTRRAGSA